MLPIIFIDILSDVIYPILIASAVLLVVGGLLGFY